ncbi:hypothetical protein BJ944DRAFT_231359 [Cunninghamella echinulata]|nr:hypothetical protein BJ944DRAFT_231359 [Cunninghamella echinulata]
MVSYFYKNQYKGIVTYISCHWLNEIDLESSDVTIPICQLTLTNISDFYKGTITCKDLEDFKKGKIEKDTLKKVIQAGLQGEQEYQGDELNWKTVFTEDGCKMTLIGYLNNALPMQVGSFLLPQVNADSNNKALWQEWLENTSKGFANLKESQMALLERNSQLEKNYKECESMANKFAIEKQDNEKVLFEKFIALLNNKKRKIMKLQEQLKKFGSSTINPISNQLNESIIPEKKRQEKTLPAKIINSSLSIDLSQTSQQKLKQKQKEPSYIMNNASTDNNTNDYGHKRNGTENGYQDGDDDDDLQELFNIAPIIKRKAANPKIAARKKQKQRDESMYSPISINKNSDTDDEDF